MPEFKNIPFEAVDWDKIPAEEHRGERGTSLWRTIERGSLRVRRVDYSAGFRADHWCPRGHVLLVLEGSLALDLKDGLRHVLQAGSGFIAGDDAGHPHLVHSESGARVFIVD